MNLDLIADGLCLIADGLRTEKKERKKTSAARMLAPDATAEDWRTIALESKKDPEQSNVYQILLAHVGSHNKPFDVFDMTSHRDKNPFKSCSRERLMLELKLLEAEKAAAPIDDLRQKWILLK